MIPVKLYQVTLTYANTSFVQNTSSNEVTIKRDLRGLQKVKVVAITVIDTQSSAIEKVARFDLTPPKLLITEQGIFRSIDCQDEDSGCYRVDYGLSESLTSCIPSQNYNGSSIDSTNYVLICAKAIDRAGNSAEQKATLKSIFNGSKVGPKTNVSNKTNTTTDNNEPEIPPIYQPEVIDNQGVSLAIVASIFVLVFSMSGGAYYAYRKGYLNNELRRLGISQRGLPPIGGTERESERRVQPVSPVEERKQRKKAYDEHLKKLNRFIDDTMDKRTKVFKNFEESSKGKTEKYNDTMIRKKSALPTKRKDVFYEKSVEPVKTKPELIREAEKFEDYYKKKKEKDKKGN